MAIEETYRWTIDSTETGDGFEKAEEKLDDIFDAVREGAKDFNKLEDEGTDAFSEIAKQATQAESKTGGFLAKIASARTPLSALRNTALETFAQFDGAVDFVVDTFNSLQGEITTTEGALSALNRGFSNIDIAQVEVANESFQALRTTADDTLSNIRQQIAVGVAPSLGALASIVNLNAQSFDGLSERVDLFARSATVKVAEVADGLKLLFAPEGEDLLQSNLNLALAQFRDFTNRSLGRDTEQQDRDAVLKAADALEAASLAFGSSAALVEQELAEIDRKAAENSKKFDELRDSIDNTTGSLAGLTLGGNTASSSLDRIFEKARDGISGLDLSGIDGFNLSEVQLARVGLSELESSELAKVLGLDLSDSKKEELSSFLRAQISALDLKLQLRAEASVDEVNANEETQKLVELYQANLDRNPLEMKIAADTVAANKLAADAKESNAELSALQAGLNATAGAFGNFARAATEEGETSFKNFQRIQVAFSTAAAISAAIQSGGFAASAGPAAAFSAYASVAGALLGAVASLKSINTSGGGGGGAASLSGGRGATPAGPIGDTQEGNRFGDGGDTLNLTIIGEDSDTVTIRQLRNLKRLLMGNEAERRGFQRILN